jgi:hypothetical protein
VETLRLKLYQQGKKGKEMELLLITLSLAAVAIVGQFGDACYRRLTGTIGL